MGLRFYICPVVPRPLIINGQSFGSYCVDVPVPHMRIAPTNADGTPLFNWSIVFVRSADFAKLDADATLERVFGIDLPDSIDTKAELKAFLQSKTVGDIPLARRQALNTRLMNRGIDTSQVTLQTTWLQVLRGILAKQLSKSLAEVTGDELGV